MRGLGTSGKGGGGGWKVKIEARKRGGRGGKPNQAFREEGLNKKKRGEGAELARRSQINREALVSG